MNDLDTPNTKPGYCPECGTPVYWLSIAAIWECGYCNWSGRFSNPTKLFQEPSKNV